MVQCFQKGWCFMGDSETKTPKTKKSRLRSPAYPAMALEEAIEKVRLLYNAEGHGRHPIPATSIAKHWGYSSEKTSQSLTGISALKQFGLLEEIPDAEPRELKLTPTSHVIIVHPPQSFERTSAIKEAALKPKIFAELWQKYGTLLPSSETLKAKLITDKLFNPDVVDDLIDDYKATISFAKLDSSDKIKENQAEENEQPPDNDDKGRAEKPLGELMTAIQAPAATPRQVGAATVLRDFAVPLDDGGTVVMRVPFPLSTEDFDTLLATLNLWKRKLTGTPQQQRSTVDTGPAKIEMDPT